MGLFIKVVILYPQELLTMSELKVLTLMLRMELLVRDHTLVLCLNAALT